MESAWSGALWPQFGAAIDMLDNAVAACPDALWSERIWPMPSDHEQDPSSAQFWYLTYHCLLWLDLYLAAVPEAQFAPPAPFTRAEIDPQESLPEQPYTKEQLRGYLAYVRQKACGALSGFTEEQAQRPYAFPWDEEHPISYLELQLYNMRHVQEHAAQLSLFLGQHAVPDEALDWVPQARGESDESDSD